MAITTVAPAVLECVVEIAMVADHDPPWVFRGRGCLDLAEGEVGPDDQLGRCTAGLLLGAMPEGCGPGCPCIVCTASRRRRRIAGLDEEEIARRETQDWSRPRPTRCPRCHWPTPSMPLTPPVEAPMPAGPSRLLSQDRRCALDGCGVALDRGQRKFCSLTHERASHGRSDPCSAPVTSRSASVTEFPDDDEVDLYSGERPPERWGWGYRFGRKDRPDANRKP